MFRGTFPRRKLYGRSCATLRCYSQDFLRSHRKFLSPNDRKRVRRAAKTLAPKLKKFADAYLSSDNGQKSEVEVAAGSQLLCEMFEAIFTIASAPQLTESAPKLQESESQSRKARKGVEKKKAKRDAGLEPVLEMATKIRGINPTLSQPELARKLRVKLEDLRKNNSQLEEPPSEGVLLKTIKKWERKGLLPKRVSASSSSSAPKQTRRNRSE
jgi:hypothetical protein